jgi:hypothetical protein
VNKKNDTIAIFFITIVTIVIWVWAEREDKQTESYNTTIQFVSPDGSTIRFTPDTKNIRLTLWGSQRALDKAKALCDGGITLTLGLPDGKHTLELRKMIIALDSIRETGAEVSSTNPESVMIHVQELELVDVNVVPLWTSVQIIGVPTVDPKTVKLEIPKENRHLLPDAITVYAVVSDDALKDMKPNVSRKEDASIKFISTLDELGDKSPLDKFGIKSDPSRVTVQFQIQSNTQKITVKAVDVHVHIAGPAEYLNKYSITLPRTFGQDVTFEVDINIIDRIKSKDVTVFAIVQLLARELKQEITEKPVTTFLAIMENGSGLELKVVNSELLDIKLNIKKIKEIEKIEEIAE